MTNALRTAVLGFGVTGRSVVRHLLGQGVTPVVLDSRSPQTVDEAWPALDLHWHCDEWPEQVIAQTDCAVVSPGLPPQHGLVKGAIQAQIPLLSDIDLFFREVNAPVIGVTGTNGKSTVVSLVGHLLNAFGMRCAVGGNLGVPALELLDDSNDIYVLELSSFQLAYSAELSLASAALLNISDDHQDWHGDFASYVKAKRRILPNASYRVGVVDCDFDVDAQVAVAPPGKNQWGVKTASGESWIFFEDTRLCPVSSLPIAGRHNVENCLWALALVAPWIAPSPAAQLLSGFSGLPHRFSLVKGPGSIRCINDSKATNVGATLAALAGFPLDKTLILIAGGDSKGADLAPLGVPMRDRVRLLISLGQNAPEINAVAERHDVSWCQVETMAQAVAMAFEHAKPSDTVLLSPACSSLDMYPNFAARGDHFEQLVAQHMGLAVAEAER